jgi:hypothetical protein
VTVTFSALPVDYRDCRSDACAAGAEASIAEAEQWLRRAADHGSRAVRLDTNETLTEAIAMYRSAGYDEVDAFNDEPYAHHWFEKTLTPQTSRS